MPRDFLFSSLEKCGVCREGKNIVKCVYIFMEEGFKTGDTPFPSPSPQFLFTQIFGTWIIYRNNKSQIGFWLLCNYE